MKFLLSDRTPFRLPDPSIMGQAKSSISIDPANIRPCDENSSESIELCDKLRQQFQASLPLAEYDLVFELLVLPMSSTHSFDGTIGFGLGVFKGPVTNALVELCGQESKLQLTFTNLRSEFGSYDKINSSEMKLGNYGNIICQDLKFCTELDTVWDVIGGPNLHGNLTVAVICDGIAVPGPVAIDKMQVNRKMLLEEIRSDVVIIPENGKQVKAHTNVLAAHSDVFSAMFRNDMWEAKTHTVEMPDMSEEGVRGLLAYLYCWEEEEPNAKPLVAFEMLHAGHKYNISVLEAAMKKLLLDKPEKWYDVEVAMKLFLLARNLPEDGHALKMKVIQVMKM